MNTLVKALIAAAVVVGIAAAIFLAGGDPKKDQTRDNPSTVSGNGEQVIEPITGIETPPQEAVDVTGTVKNDAGNVLADVTVECRRVTGMVSSPKFDSVGATKSSSDGSFRFEGLASGIYDFAASAAGYPTAKKRVTLAEGAEQPVIELILASGLTIRGTIRDPLGAPVSGALVGAFLERVDPEESFEERILHLIEFEDMKNEPGVFATSDEAGEYTIVGLENDSYRLQVIASTFAPEERRFVKAGSVGVDFNLQIGGQLIGTVVDVAGGPIAGALVEIYRSSDSQDLMEIILERVLPPLDRRETDASGTFHFDAIGGEFDYRLVARASGYQTHGLEKVRVELGQQSELLISLDPGSTIRGVVYDPFGSVLEGARCKVNPVGGGQPASPPTDFNDDSIVTDGAGEFVFDSLGAGNFRLVVSHEDFATHVDAKLQTSDQQLTIHLTEGCAVTGAVFDATSNEPVAGAVITVHDVGGEQKSGISDASGVFFVRGISEQRRGVAHVNIDALGYQRVANYKMDVTEGIVTGPENFFLERNGTVRGMVIDANGQAIEGVRISARRTHATNAVVVSVGEMTTSAADGSFILSQVEAGGETFLEGAHHNYLTSRGEIFALESGQELSGLELVMRIGGAISGRVIDENGQPVADATVGAKDDVMSVVNPASLTNKAYTDAQGNYTLRRLDSGELTLLCAARGYLTIEVTGLQVTEGRTTTGVEVRMTTGAHISGTVRNSLGAPLANARVTVIDTSAGLKKLTTSTDTNGQYHFDELGYFPVDVEAETTGYGNVRLFEQPVNQEGVDFVLEAFGAIRGMAYAESGEPLRAFSVSPKLIDLDGRAKPRVAARTFSNTNGSYEFDGLQPGVYEVMIGAPGFAPEILENIVVQSDRVSELPSVALGEGGRISGFIIDARTGEPIPGATVTVIGGNRHFLPVTETRPQPAAGRRDLVTTAADGSFDLIGLSSQRVTLKFEHRSYMSEVVRDVQSGTKDLEMALGAGGTIEGTVTRGGVGVASQSVLLASGGKGQDRRVVTDRKGWYSITGLPSGDYVLRVMNFGSRENDEKLRDGGVQYDAQVFEGETTILDIPLD